MAKWHAQPEFAQLRTHKPDQLIGFCVVDENHQYYKEDGARWISLDRSAAEEMAAELNEGDGDG